MLVNNFATCIKTLDPRAKPEVLDAGLHKASVSRLGFHAVREVPAEGDFTVGLNEPDFHARFLIFHADLLVRSALRGLLHSIEKAGDPSILHYVIC